MKPQTSIPDQILAFIYFIGFEVLVYYGLSYLLFDQVPRNADPGESTIVRNWNNFLYFVLLYVAITVGTMLFLTSAISRRHKPRIMRYFWWSWLGLAVMVGLIFN